MKSYYLEIEYMKNNKLKIIDLPYSIKIKKQNENKLKNIIIIIAIILFLMMLLSIPFLEQIV